MSAPEWRHVGLRAWALVAVTLASRVAWAGPPYRTDDPEAVQYQHLEVNVFSQQILTAAGRTGVLPGIEYNYGIMRNVQFHVGTPFAFDTVSGQGTEKGYGDTELGIKWQSNEQTETMPMIALYPLVEIPTGNHDKGLGNGASQIFLPVWIQRKWGNFQTYGGGGYWFNNGTDNRNYWFFGWQVQYQLSDQVTLGAEIFHNAGQVVGQTDSTGFNMGGSYNLDEHNHLLVSAGKGLQNAALTNRVSTYVGYQLSF